MLTDQIPQRVREMSERTLANHTKFLDQYLEDLDHDETADPDHTEEVRTALSFAYAERYRRLGIQIINTVELDMEEQLRNL